MGTMAARSITAGRQLDPMLGDAELLASGHAAAALGSLQWPPPSSSKSYSANLSWPNAEAVNSGTRCRQLGRSSFHFVFNWKSPLAVGSHAGGPCLPNSPPCWTTVLGACHFSCWTSTSPGYARCSGRCVVPPMQLHSGPLFLACWNLFGRWRTHLAAPCRARCHAGGLKGQACTQNGKSLGFFCLSGQKTLALGAGGQPMCLFPALEAFRPHSTSLSQLLSGLKAYVRLVAKPLRLQMLTPTSRQTTSRLHRFARIKGYGFNRWWSSPQVLGPLRLRILFDYLPEPQQPVKAKMRLLATPISCRSSVLPLAAFAAGRPFVVEPSLSAPRRRMSPDGMLPCFLPLRPARVEVECEVTCFVCNQSPSRP